MGDVPIKAGPPTWKQAKPGSWPAGKDAADLDVIEFDGRPTALVAIHRRDAKTGNTEEVPVRVCAPSHQDKAKARLEALEWVGKLAKLPARPTWKEACELLGESYVDQMDTVCLVARCTRDHDAPEHQHKHFEELDRFYGRTSLLALWERVCQFDQDQDPRIHELDEDQFWEMVTTIDRMRSILPLAVIDGDARDSLVLSMASRLVASRKHNSP